jgi:hypothetical protein
LAAGCFAAKTPDYGYWILLDFLGFSRLNLDLSMGYGTLSENNFSLPFPGVESAVEGSIRPRAYGSAELFMELA